MRWRSARGLASLLALAAAGGVLDGELPSGPVAAFAFATSLSGGVHVALGEVVKLRTPLLVQDRPWERRCDNSYPEVIREGATWRLWYGCVLAGTDFDAGIGKSRVFGWLHARSPNGIAWHKPDLGVFDLKGSKAAEVNPALTALGTRNNIVLGDGDGVGILLDPTATDPRQRFKLMGDMEAPPQTRDKRYASSPNGLTNWTSVQPYRPTRIRLAPNASYDWCVPPAPLAGRHRSRGEQPGPHVASDYRVMTDTHNNMFWDERKEEYFVTTRVSQTRALATFRSKTWPPPDDVELVMGMDGCAYETQVYSQITFPWAGVYLGLAAVFYLVPDRIATHLTWSLDGENWSWVAGKPACLPAPGHERERHFRCTFPKGQPFIPVGEPGAFDEYITFPSRPVPVSDAPNANVRIYIAGGNGPHFGSRNTSIGLAMIRADRYVSLTESRGQAGGAVIGPLLCTGPLLLITADVGPTGSLAVGLLGAAFSARGGVSMGAAIPLVGANVTRAPLRFVGGGDFSAHVGKRVVLEARISSASLYTVGFGRHPPTTSKAPNQGRPSDAGGGPSD
ncbi:hypothetical protein T492DRAFT_1067697 [Pavlovales sp. CCMP2436]|nr:hypothetical protein T492DRAFT_1067697 [Pavlovales sp. CCMP2436]